MRVPILHHPRMLRKCFFKANDRYPPPSLPPRLRGGILLREQAWLRSLFGASPTDHAILCHITSFYATFCLHYHVFLVGLSKRLVKFSHKYVRFHFSLISQNMKLHLPNALRSALLSCLAAIAPLSVTVGTATMYGGILAYSISTSQVQAATTVGVTDSEGNKITTTVDGVTYAGYVLTLDYSATGGNSVSNAENWNDTFHNATFTYIDGNDTLTSIAGDRSGGPLNQLIWQYFANGNISNKTGNTLVLTGATQNTRIETQFSAFSIGGLMVKAQQGTNYSYTLGRLNDNYEIYFEAAEDVAVNADIDSDVTFRTKLNDTCSVVYKNGGQWDIAEGKTLTFDTTKVILESTVKNLVFTGGGIVDMQTATLSIEENASLTLGINTTLETEDLENSGTIYFSEGSKLNVTTINDSILYDNQTFEIGNICRTDGTEVDNWAAYLEGIHEDLEITYADGVFTARDIDAYYWNGTEASNIWSENNLTHNGNASAITTGVNLYLADTAANKTVHMDTSVELGSLILLDGAYILNVSADNTVPDRFIVADPEYGLTKTGAATLEMTTVQLAKLSEFTLAEGTLKLTDTLAQVNYGDNSSVDLTNISAVEGAILSIAASGNENSPGKGTGTNVSHIQLSDTFEGSLEVRDGKLHIVADGETGSSQLGGTTKLLLNGGGIIITTGGGSFGAQTLSKDIEVGASGGYIDLFGSSTSKNDGWSARHTGSLTGAGLLTFIGYGEWILGGNYDSFTGGIKMGAEFQRMYISSDMPGLTSILNETVRSDADVVVGYEKSVTVSVANEERIIQPNVIWFSNASTFEHNGGISIDSNKTFTVQAYNEGDTGTYNVKNINFASGAKLSVETNIEANITGTEQYMVSAGEIAIATGAEVNDNRHITLTGAFAITGGGTYNQLGSVTINDGGSLALSGNVSFNNLTNNGHITVRDALTITLDKDANIRDNGRLQLGSATLNIEGTGIYHLNALQLSYQGDNNSTVNIGSGATLHITGTSNGSDGGSFLTGTNSKSNSVNVSGRLELDCGISHGDSDTSVNSITVNNGGTLAFNNGITASNTTVKDVVNINGGGVLEVSGEDTDGTNNVNININREAVILGGNASSNAKSLIANNLHFSNGAYIGAKEGTQLSLTAANSMSWLVILGDGSEEGGDTLGSTLGAGGEVRFTESITTGNLYVRKGGAATFENGLTANNNASTNNGELSVTGPLNLVGFTNKGNATLSGELNLSNFVTNEAGADLTLRGATLSLSQAIANSGKITIENPADTIIKLENLQETKVTGAVQTWSIINNAGNGSLEGWDTLALSNFSLNGETLTLGDWDAYSIENGRVSLYMLYRYWDSVAGEDTATWDTDTTAVWRDNTADEGLTYESGSRVAFGDYEDVDDINGGSGTTLLNKTVSVSGAGVTARALDIFGTDYVFQGGDVAVTDNMSIQQSARFDSSLLIGSSTKPLTIDVWEGHTLTISDLKTRYTATYGTPVYEDGSFVKTGSGTLAVTNGIHGTITSATVNEGKLELGAGVTLAVGDNRLTGGSIENAVFLTTGEITRAYSQNTVTAHNIIKAADGSSNAVLADVTLHVGTKDAYATLQDITFAGNSALTGYITFEHTQNTNDMAVATGATLAVNGVSFDLHGLSGGDKVLIANEHSLNSPDSTRGSITGWNTAKFLYSGVAINAAAIDTSINGMVTIITDGQNTAANLYWDGSPNGQWDTITTNWSNTAGTDGNEVFTALSNVYFSTLPEAGVQDISVSRDMVVATLNITQGGYRFNDARISALGNTNIQCNDGEVIFSNNRLDTQGVLSTSGTGTTTFDTSVTAGSMDLQGFHTIINGTTTVAGTLNINAGSEIAHGSVTIDGNITAQDINIAVQAGRPEEATYADARVIAEGTITASGTMTLGGTATQQYLNTVTANTININNTTHGIYFSDVRVEQMNIVEGAHAHILKRGETIAESSISNVNLAGTLLLDAYAATYNKELNITTGSDSAALFFGTGCTVNNIYISGTAGDAFDNGYSDLDIESNARYVTIQKIDKLGDLSIRKGTITVQSAVEAVHHTLQITDNGGLNLLSDNIMAEGSGNINILDSTLALNGTSQILRSGNTLNLSSATISGEASGTGLNFIEDGELHYSGRNTISANMTVAGDTALSIVANKQAEDMLTISGGISGSGNINITGNGVVALSAANAYTGLITISDISTLALQHADALANATLKLESDAILHADRMLSVTPYNIGNLNLDASGSVMINGVQHDAGTIQINNLVATDSVSAADAAFKLGALESSSDFTLNVLLGFDGDKSLENMKTYNLFTSEAGLDISNLNISLHVIGNDIANHVADNQFKVGYDEAAKTIYIRTMLGNIWDGGSDNNGDGTWSLANPDLNWSGKNYDEASAYNDAIFVDIDNVETATVKIEGIVTPGDVYFEADSTNYILEATGEDNHLAAGTHIHKAGSGSVTFNADSTAPLGNLDVQEGTFILSNAIKTNGIVSIGSNAILSIKESLDNGIYTVKGTYGGLIMDSAGISGNNAATPGTVQDATITGGAYLSDLALSGNGTLSGVTIGKGLSIGADSTYSLSGNISFTDTVTGAGTLDLAPDVVLELGQMTPDIDSTVTVSTDTYQLLSGGSLTGVQNISAANISLNGVNLANGLAEGITANASAAENGAVTISFGDAMIAIPVWDARWGEDSAPALTRRFVGTNAASTITFGEGNGIDEDYYAYGRIVKNGGNDLAVTLSAAATGAIAAGRATGTEDVRETWIYDRSAIGTVVGGVYRNTATDAASGQRGATHLYVDVAAESGKTLIVGGSYNANQEGDSYLTIKNGTITDAVGGSYNGDQTGTARVYVDGGTITNLYAGGYNSSLTAIQTEDGNKQAVEMLLTGGSLSKVVGGGYNGSIEGDIYVRADGSAEITSMLVGGSQGGSVDGNIVLDLVSGSAVAVHAAGTSNASVTRDVTVNLYKDFKVTDSLHGGKQNNSGVSNIGGTSTLHFADAGDYILGKSHNYVATSDSITISGFDILSLAEDAHVVVILNHFDINCKSGAEDLVVSGPGILEVLGNSMNFSRNVTLTDSATLKISTSGIGQALNTSDDRTVTVTKGSTIDFSGFPIEAKGGDSALYPGLGFNTIISGDGVDNKGAIYKGEFLGEYNPTEDQEQGGNNPVNKICLPKITLADNASAVVTEGEYLYMNQKGLEPSSLTLNEYTFTKRGEGHLIARTVAISAGTVLVHEGMFGADLVCKGKAADMVLAGNASLQLNSTNLDGTHSLEIRSLSGAGDVVLNGSMLTLHTTDGSEYYDKYMDEAQSYDQFMSTTGFVYSVYNGVIADGDKGIGILSKAGNGVHYLSGNDSTYSGGTHINEGRLYLLGSSTQQEFVQGGSSVEKGVVGTGALVWESSAAELYLGHGVRIYNGGTTNVAGAMMTIGVDGAPQGTLSNFIGIHSLGENDVLEYVTMGGTEYVEIDTHNLQTISVDAVYADGSSYVAGTEIDRNKMLLIKAEEWSTAQNATVTGFTETGYNEATYSGVLKDTINEGVTYSAGLRKVGIGTLILDQANTYTGNTVIAGGTLVLQGWAQLGASSDSLYVDQQSGTSLKLSYDGSYGNEITEIANNIQISGTGDGRWYGDSATDGKTAALISDIGSDVRFTLSGNISGDGNVLHTGDGTLVMSGDSSYTGGTEATRGTIEIQSAQALGASETSAAVVIAKAANLHATVEDGFNGSSMTTLLAAKGNVIKGNVVISGTTETERIFHMASNGYDASSTTLHDNGTLLTNGSGIVTTSGLLTGSGKVVVSDASGSAARADVQSMVDYSGDFIVEGDNASINVESGVFKGGSMDISGQNAFVKTKADIIVATNQHLALSSTGTARGEDENNTSAFVSTTGVVTVNNGAEFSVSFEATEYDYDLKNLQNNSSISAKDLTILHNAQVQEMNYISIGNSALEYDSHFNKDLAVNGQAAGAVQADNGLEFTGGSTYKADKANTSLLGGTLLLNPDESSLINFTMITEGDYAAMSLQNPDLQVVLFTDVGSVFFGLDDVTAEAADNGIYFTQANRYLTGCPYISDETLLVYDAYTQTVYLHYTVPEPTTATLSMLALAALAARRRRRK